MNETKIPLLLEIVLFIEMKAVRLHIIVHITQIRKVKGPPIKHIFGALRKMKRLRTILFPTLYKRDIYDLKH